VRDEIASVREALAKLDGTEELLADPTP